MLARSYGYSNSMRTSTVLVSIGGNIDTEKAMNSRVNDKNLTHTKHQQVSIDTASCQSCSWLVLAKEKRGIKPLIS